MNERILKLYVSISNRLASAKEALKDDEGASAVEYAMLIGAAVTVVIGAAAAFSETASGAISTLGSKVAGFISGK